MEDSLWFGLFSEINFSEELDNVFLNAFHGPSFILANIIRLIFWIGLVYLLFIRENRYQWYVVVDWLKHFVQRKQSTTEDTSQRTLPKKMLWKLFGQFLFVLLVIVLQVGSVARSVSNYARLADQTAIVTDRRATAVVLGTDKGGRRSSYGRVVLLVDQHPGGTQIVNIANANKSLVGKINKHDKKLSAMVSVDAHGKIVQISIPALEE